MEAIPQEIVKTILSYTEEINSGIIRCVCKRWKTLVTTQTPHLRKVISYNAKHNRLNILRYLKSFHPTK